MSYNLELPNGIKLLYTGIVPGDRLGDTLPTLALKFNANMQIVLTRQDNLAGEGLVWDTERAKLSLDELLPNTLRIGRGVVSLNEEEFRIDQGTLNLNRISPEKFEGLIDLSSIALTQNTIPVGTSAGNAAGLQLSNEFQAANSVFSIRTIEFNKIQNVLVTPERIALGENQIPIGQANNQAEAVELGSDFVVRDGVLTLRSSQQLIGIDSIQARGIRQVGSVLTVTQNNGQLDLSWNTPEENTVDFIRRFIKADRPGFAIYVNAETGSDSISNYGTSEFTAFKTLNRALLEVARQSYVAGRGTEPDQLGSDRFDRVVVYVASGNYEIDNRPGLGLDQINPLSLSTEITNYSIYNPVGGGLIVPRGVSIVGSDLRKTKIYGRLVPDPTLTGATLPILRFTGASYFYGFTFVDNPIQQYSHHRLTCAEFVSSSDLDLYYQKIFKSFSGVEGFSQTGGENLQAARAETEIVSDMSSATATDNFGRLKANNVYGASPYIFNCSVRSRYGLSGIYADGSLVSGLKSIVTAQFTHVSLQADPRAFEPDPENPGRTRYAWKHFAFKATNDAYMQIVSCFVIANAEHFVVESGGELSITNSCSNFGGTSLVATGSSPSILPQDEGISIIKVVPPEIIESEVREIIGASLDTDRVSPSSVGVVRILNIQPIDFVNGSYLYIRVPNPNNPGQFLDLQARLVTNGATRAGSSPTDLRLNVDNGASVSDRNEIYLYLNCLTPFVYESAWYDSSIDPDLITDTTLRDQLIQLGLAKTRAQQLEAERVLRIRALDNTDIFVKRILDERSIENQHYRWIIQVPTGRRVPVDNYIFRHPQLDPQSGGYFVTEVALLPEDQVETNYGGLPGRFYTARLLRASKPVENTLTQDQKRFPDTVDDIRFSESYLAQTYNLDSRLYSDRVLRSSVSFDSSDLTYLAARQFLLDFGYTSVQVNQTLLPRLGVTILSRSASPPNRPRVYQNGQITGALSRPSTLRCSGHTWEWPGMQNYSTALPKLQTETLTRNQSLRAMQSATFGGRIYATGMNELGEFFIGQSSVNLKTGQESRVRFDAVSLNNGAQEQPKTLRELSITGRLVAQQITVSQLNLGATITFSPASRFQVQIAEGVTARLDQTNIPSGIKSTQTQFGLSRLATTEEAKSLSPSEAVMTPSTTRDLAASYFSTLIRHLVRVRLSLSAASSRPTQRVTNSTSLFLHPHEGAEISVYNASRAEWIVLSMPVSANGTLNPIEFTFASLGITLPGRNYDIYLYNRGTLFNPLIGLHVVPWVDDLAEAPARDNRFGFPCAVDSNVPTGRGIEYRLIGVVRTNSTLGAAVSSSTRLGGSYLKQNTAKITNEIPALSLSNYYNPLPITLCYFFEDQTQLGWSVPSSIWSPPPAPWGLNARTEFVLAKPTPVQVSVDIYSNDYNLLVGSSFCYGGIGMSIANATRSSDDDFSPQPTTNPAIFVPVDMFFAEASGFQSSTSIWNRIMASGNHNIWYLYILVNTNINAQNRINEHGPHGMTVTLEG
ncbi:hypothetical protein ACQ4M3_09435 [Leptolyngbya sp. AN03gr2]|uniref:hypothetical protein n=1 Tax=Leptolyngbya sp. AN03gr2 TaxID=3423364 RepID=UPI003D310D79